MKNPILVSRRTTELSPDDLRKFAIEANDRTTLGMSEAEKARADAQRAAAVMPPWRGSTAAAARSAPAPRPGWRRAALR